MVAGVLKGLRDCTAPLAFLLKSPHLGQLVPWCFPPSLRWRFSASSEGERLQTAVMHEFQKMIRILTSLSRVSLLSIKGVFPTILPRAREPTWKALAPGWPQAAPALWLAQGGAAPGVRAARSGPAGRALNAGERLAEARAAGGACELWASL